MQMKKFWPFRTSTDKQDCAESPSNNTESNQLKTRDVHSSASFRSQNNPSENQWLNPNAVLRRSHSFSSAGNNGNAQRNISNLNEQSSSPSSSSSSVNAQKHHSRSSRHVKPKRSTRVPLEKDYVGGKPPSSRSSRRCHDHSISSNEVLDLYIDGEQDFGRGSPLSKTSLKDRSQRIHYTAPSSPTCSIKDHPRPPPSFRGLEPYPSSRKCRESPKELARHVVEKLCSRDFDYSDVPITIEDVYSRSSKKNATLKENSDFLTDFALCKDHASINGAHFGVDDEDKVDLELKSKLQEAKDMIMVLSEELESESFLDDIEFNVPALVQRIKELTEEKTNLALRLSNALEGHLTDRTSLKDRIDWSAMEKELDRRSNDWSMKVETFQAEELRLRERVRELAEQNVSLQREVSSYSEMETDKNKLENHVHDLNSMLEASQTENQELRLRISELEEKYKVADEDRVFMQRNYGEKEEECKDLHKCVTKLIRTCNDQEKTIDGLRSELTEVIQRKHPMENSERHVRKLQMEQIRLTGVEEGLRKEIQSYKTEVDSLRHENINLLNRLRSGGDQGCLSSVKLDEELRGTVDVLQKQGLSLFNESAKTCSKLLESLKRVSRVVGKENIEIEWNCLDEQFIMESGMKVQGFRRDVESLKRSLQNVSNILREKSNPFSNSSPRSMDDSSFDLQNGSNLQDLARSELKAEVLLTSLLREKLYAKSQEVEQLLAEVATATRGNEILRCEVQNALDSLSAATHKMKDLELQMMKKEEKINQLQNDLQESTKELTVIRGILPKVSEERDIMWEEVKKHTEKNMLWNSEVNLLKKKIETLDEELLLKEGEITILRDGLGNKSFNLLASPDRSHEFLLE